MKSLSSGMLIILALMILSFSLLEKASAQNASGPSIFDVRRSLPLEPDEPVTKDFYINAGPESGLKKGLFVLVVRAVLVHDPIQNKQQATLNIPVGKLKVIDVQRGITVARLQTELGDDERPTLEFEGVMIGDHVDLATMTAETPKSLKPRKRTQAEHLAAPARTETASAQTDTPELAVSSETTAVAPATMTALEPTTDLTALPQPSPVPQPSATNEPADKSSSSSTNAPVTAPVQRQVVPKTSQPPASASAIDSIIENAYDVPVDTPDFA